MIPTNETSLDLIGVCICDLNANGIDLLDMSDRARFLLVQEHIDYFQMMLGYDSDPGEILQLLRDLVARN